MEEEEEGDGRQKEEEEEEEDDDEEDEEEGEHHETPGEKVEEHGTGTALQLSLSRPCQAPLSFSTAARSVKASIPSQKSRCWPAARNF